jgi:hypothetical protein
MSDRRLPDMPPSDLAALKLAIETQKDFSAVDRDQIDHMLGREDWFGAARFAAYGAQSRTLKLKPWQPPPCWVRAGDLEEPFGDVFRAREAAELLQRMLALGISRYHPDPLKAIERPVAGPQTERLIRILKHFGFMPFR